MTSENVERVRTIGSHVAGLFTVFTIKFSTGSGSMRLLTGAAAVILQQVTGKDVMTGSLADLANLPLGC